MLLDRNHTGGRERARNLLAEARAAYEDIGMPKHVEMAIFERPMTRNPGRFAGLLYVLISIPGFFAILYVPSKLIVHGNATATAGNIATHEMLFRLGIACSLIGQAGFIFVALALYDLLKGVNPRQALVMLTLILVGAPIALLNELNAIAALVLVRGTGFFVRI